MDKKKISKFLMVIAIILLIGFVVILGIDYFKYDKIETSSPFYTYIIARSLEFLLPSIVLLITSKIINKK